ncbi:MAG: RidA family protein [Cytophagales bacterium]|nr:RidA family protein [Cytophagales bacterium]
MKKKSINPSSLFNSREYGFSQVVVSNPGKMVFISGQVAWDEKQNIVGENDLAKQTQQSINNLKLAIEAAGGTLENIVMLNIYIVNYQKEDSLKISKILKDNFGTVSPPATTWVSVQGLANKEFMIEIEAQGVI